MTEPPADVRAPAEEPAAPQGPRPRRRGRETVRDMVLSLAVVGIVVVFLVAVTYRARPDPIHVIDPTSSVEAAQALAPFTVVVPVGLPTTWRPTSARYDPADTSPVPNAALWHVGYVTPAGAYASLDQAQGDPPGLLRTLVAGAHEVGPGSGAFAGWQRWESGSGDRQAYVLTGSVSTVVVYGTAGDAELATLEESLVPDPAVAVDTANASVTD